MTGHHHSFNGDDSYGICRCGAIIVGDTVTETRDMYTITERAGVRWWSTTTSRYEVRRGADYVTSPLTRRGARRAIRNDKRRRAKGERVIYREAG
jgi:hypothetical protein